MERRTSHKKIESLSDEVKAVIRTGVALTNFAQVVEELVLNSIDAGATSVAVRVDLPLFKVQVVDNGSGISLEQFSFIGQRYSTSKCHSVQDLENLKYFGYRGEAVASLAAASAFMEISSRTAHSRKTYTKPFLNGRPQALVPADTHRPCAGTTVTAFDLFHNLPVRRKRLSEALEMEAIRYRLSGLALMWPLVSFSLRDDAAGHVILQTYKCSGVAAAFSNIFTPARARKLMEIEPVQNDEFKISGLVSVEGYSRKDLQFVFVNKRLVLKSSIHKQVNKILSRSLILKRKGVDSDMAAKLPTIIEDINKSPVKQGDRYGVFVISIECPYKSYDITFDPSKTLIEFRDWPKLIHLLQDMLYPFLRKHNLLASGESLTPLLPGGLFDQDPENYNEDASSESSEPVKKQAVDENRAASQLLKFGRNICLTDTRNGILSKAVCRQKKTEVNKIIDEPGAFKIVHNDLEKKSSRKFVDEDLTLLESPLVIGLASNKCNEELRVEKYNKRHKTLFKAPAVEQPQHIRYCNTKQNVHKNQGLTQDETNSSLCQRKMCNKGAETITQASHSGVRENPLEHQNTHPLKNPTKTVIFESGEYKIPPAHAPLKPVITDTNCNRKEITLSTGTYLSSLGQLREGIQGDKGVGQKSKAPEIMTDSLQQLRRSARQAISELGDLYKTPERVGSRRKSSDSCSSTDDPIITKQAKTGQYTKMSEDIEGLEDFGSMLNKTKHVQRLNSNQPMSIVESGSIHSDKSISKAPLHLSRDPNTDLFGLGESNNLQHTLTATLRTEPVKHLLPEDGPNFKGSQATACFVNHNTISLATDRQSFVGNPSRSQLKLVKASSNSDIYPPNSSISNENSQIGVSYIKNHEKVKRKSPQMLTHSNKLARLMRGESLDEESTSRRKPRSFLQGFHYRRDTNKTDHTSDDGDVCGHRVVTYRKEKPKERSEYRSYIGESGDSEYPLQKLHESVVENNKNSVFHEHYQQASQTSDKIDFGGMSNICGENKNIARDEVTYEAASRFENESYKSTPKPFASHFLSNRHEKLVHCCRCVYLRSESKQPCDTCGKLLLLNREIPFQCYESAKYEVTEEPSPKVSLALSLPILQNHMNQKSFEKESEASVKSESHHHATSRGEKHHASAHEVIGEIYNSVLSQSSQGFNLPSQQTHFLGRMKEGSGNINQASDGEIDSPPSFVSQGFSINGENVAHKFETQNSEMNCSVPTAITKSFTKKKGLDTDSRDDFNSNSSQKTRISKNEMGNSKNLIVSPGTDSEIYFEAGMAEIQSLLTISPDEVPKSPCDHVEKDATFEVNSKADYCQTEVESSSVQSRDVSSDLSSDHVSATFENEKVPEQITSHIGNQRTKENEVIRHNMETNTLKSGRAFTPHEDKTVDDAIKNSGIKELTDANSQHISSSGDKSNNFRSKTDRNNETNVGSTLSNNNSSSFQVINTLVTKTLSQSIELEEIKNDNSPSQTLTLCTIPETESLKFDKDLEVSTNNEFQVASSNQPIQRVVDVDLSTKKSNNRLSQSYILDEEHSKNNIAQSNSQESYNVVMEESQRKPYSLTLGQKSGNLSVTPKEDSDSFSIFSKPFEYDSHTDLVSAPSLTQEEELAVTENSESLFESSQRKAGSVVEQNLYSEGTHRSSSDKSYQGTDHKSLTGPTNPGNDPSCQNLNIVKSNDQVNEIFVPANDDPNGLAVYQSLCANNMKPTSAKFGTSSETHWSSGDQSLLLVEIPEENIISQTSQKHPTRQIVGDKNSDDRYDLNQTLPNCSGVPSSNQPLPQKAASVNPNKLITISAGYNPGTIQSSLSLFRDHAKLARESQSHTLQSSRSSDTHHVSSGPTKNIDLKLQIQEQCRYNCHHNDVNTPFIRNPNKFFNTDSYCSLLNEEENLQRKNIKLPTDSSDSPSIAIRDSDLVSKKNAAPSAEIDELLSLKQQKHEHQSGTRHSLMACWRKETDSLTGKTVYVNNQSGHTVTQEQWPEMSSQSLRELITAETNTNNEEEQELEPLSSSGRQAISDVINNHMEVDDAEAHSKWRGGKKFTYEKEAGMDVSTLLAKWTNPVFTHHKSVSVEAEICAKSAVAKSCFDSMSKLEFTREMLEKVKVIGQVDNKFIACEMEHTKSKMDGLPSSLLVLLDQHAVHERIRLNYFTQECYEKNGEERTNTLEKAEVNPVQIVVMDQDDVRIMKAFRREFSRIGVNFSVGEKSRTTVYISSAPVCLLEREPSEVKRKRAMSVEEKIECLIKEHINLLKSTNGACGSLPLTVHKHLCSLACHGAVKFGDQLTLSECKDLLSALARCNLPFQCAHGRPSVAPIVNITELEKEIATVKRKPSLWKLNAVMSSQFASKTK